MYVIGITTGFNTISILFFYCFLLLFKCHFKKLPLFWEAKKKWTEGERKHLPENLQMTMKTKRYMSALDRHCHRHETAVDMEILEFFFVIIFRKLFLYFL